MNGNIKEVMLSATQKLRIYYDLDNEFLRYYDGVEFGTIAKKDKCFKNHRYFHLFKGEETTDDGLTFFRSQFIKWCGELSKLHYFHYFYENNHDHYRAVEYAFEKFENPKIADLEDCNFDEYIFTEGCYNAGLMILDDNYKNKSTICYGYDFSSFYPNILVGTAFNMNMPSKQGVKTKLLSLTINQKLDYGIYKVKVMCDDIRFRKVFAFSKDNTYTHYSLKFAHKYQEMFNVRFALITDCDFNALLYDKKSLINTKTIFEKWFNILMPLKNELKGNKLIKHLTSSLWGCLTKTKKYYISEFDTNIDEVGDLHDDSKYVFTNEMYRSVNNTTYSLFECVERGKPYKYPYGRLKAFVLSVARNVVGELILKHNLVDNVIRLHTDGIVLNKQHDFTKEKYYPLPETKTTGLIYWENVNKYNLETI